MSRNLQVSPEGIIIRVMQKQKGFTLMELAVVITIVGMLTVVGAPSFSKWRKQQQFEADTQQVLSLLADARASALSNKTCDGDQTIRWVARFDDTGTTLLCENSDGEVTISSFLWKSPSIITFERALDADSGWGLVTPTMDISIFSGGTQSLIGEAYADKIARIKVDFTAIGKDSTVCFSSIANYPFLSPSGLCDED